MAENVIQFKDEQGNNLYPIILDGIREPKIFDCCFGSHRGFCSEFPENTMPAFIGAVKRGYRFLETDIVQSSDGVQFLLHDATINRTSNGIGTASQMTAAQLERYSYGYSAKFGNKFYGTPIPRLSEFLIFCKKNRCVAELDIADDARYSDSYLQNTYNEVKRAGMLDSVYFCARKERLQALLAIDPSVMVSVSMYGNENVAYMNSCFSMLANCRAANFSILYNRVTQTLIDNAHNNNFAVKVWYEENDGNDTSAHANTLFNESVDIILTDYVVPNAFDWLQ